MTQREADPVVEGRNETPLERCDRNLVELLQEVRVLQTGVQVLFGFLLMAPLTARFDELSTTLRVQYLVTTILAGAAAMLLMSPTAHHRLLFRRGDKEYLVTVAQRYTLAGLACLGLAMLGALAFVTTLLLSPLPSALIVTGAATALAWNWYVVPLRRRRLIERTASDGTNVVSLR